MEFWSYELNLKIVVPSLLLFLVIKELDLIKELLELSPTILLIEGSLHFGLRPSESLLPYLLTVIYLPDIIF